MEKPRNTERLVSSYGRREKEREKERRRIGLASLERKRAFLLEI